jgi:hypothetical protein
VTRSLETLRRELVSGSLRDFTAHREAAAAELSAAGKRAEAAALRRLKKPAPALWAVNRLAVVDPRGIAALIEQLDALRREERSASTADAARAVFARGRSLRAQVQQLEARAAQLLADSGAPVTAPTRSRIHATLLGLVSASRDERRALVAGDLDHELAPPALSDMLAAMPAATTPARPLAPATPARLVATPRPTPVAPLAGATPDHAREPRQSSRAGERRAARAKADAARLEREARRAAAEAERAERRAREHRERAEALARRAGEARRSMEQGHGPRAAKPGSRSPTRGSPEHP